MSAGLIFSKIVFWPVKLARLVLMFSDMSLNCHEESKWSLSRMGRDTVHPTMYGFYAEIYVLVFYGLQFRAEIYV